MSDGESLGEKIKRAVRGRQATVSPAVTRGGALLQRSLSDELRTEAQAALDQGGMPEEALIARVAAESNPQDAAELALLIAIAGRLAEVGAADASSTFLEALRGRRDLGALALIESAKAFSARGSVQAEAFALAAANAAPAETPIACEAAAISLRFSGSIASLRVIKAHIEVAGDAALLSADVARHAGWAIHRLEAAAVNPDWPNLARAAANPAFDVFVPMGSGPEIWTSVLLLLEAWGEGRIDLNEIEARLVAMLLRKAREELLAAGGRPKAPVTDVLRASNRMTPAALAAFTELLADFGAGAEAVTLAGRLRGTTYEIAALGIQADHSPDRWRDRILPRWMEVTAAFADDGDAQFRSGAALIRRGEVEGAIVALARAFELDPANAAYALALGGAHEVRQDWSEALAVYDRAVEANAGEAHLVRKRASMLMELGLPEQAVDVIAPLAQKGNAEPASIVVHAWALERSGRLAEAARILADADVSAASPDLLIETAVRVLSLTLLRAGLSYADRRLLERAGGIALEHIGRLPEERLWEVTQAAIELGEDGLALQIVARAVTDRGLPISGVGDTAAALLHRLSTTTLQGDLSRFADEAGPMTPQTLAMALELQGRSEIATLALTMAAMRDQQNEGLALAAGTLMQRHGHLQAAERLFTRCNRAYEDGCRNFIWPRSETGGWPRGGGPSAAAFDALLPESAQWPRITVVTPSYNQADFVEETVLSVLNQHYPNLQYIIVDGGSTDGAAEILERYRDKVDVLIIEPDKGQTDAINKGFALADGELMTWLNSDDMFAPGALHRIALEYLNSKADIIAGICVAYRDGRVEVANLPAVRQETFTVEVMADIFRYWMKGYFFYQPEVVFSRAIWEKTGGRLNDDLNFTMDYEFWMRCAQAGARFEVVHWPVALFRQHEAQKTSRLLHCVDEQAVVRDEIKQIAPSDDRSRSLVTGARERLRAEPIKVAVYTSRFDKIFSPLVEAELAHRFKDTGMSVRLFASAEDLPVDDDFIVWLVHLQNDDYAIDAYRQRGGRAQIIGWFWDNHHHLFPNRDVVERLDYWSAGHAFVSNYLANDQALKLEPTPLSVTQWARQEAEIFYREVGDQPRSDVLYGGFVRYAFAEKRNTLIQALMDEGEEGVYFLEEADARRYFDRSRRSRFAEWAAHKTSLCLPLDGDLSQRLFDALLTGQVPIAPKDIADLDAVIPPALQKKLPIVRFDKYKPGDVKAAHAKALKLFDEGGAEGAMVRHRIALESHMFSDRIAALLDKVRALADGR